MAGAVATATSDKVYTAQFTWYMFFSCVVAGAPTIQTFAMIPSTSLVTLKSKL